MLALEPVELLDDPIMGFGAAALTDQEIQAMAERLARFPGPSSWELARLLEQYDEATQGKLVAAIVAKGGSASTAERALAIARERKEGRLPRGWRIGLGILATLLAAASGYHGYRRNDSLGWGIGWFLLGGLFPVITPTIALAQGFAKPKR